MRKLVSTLTGLEYPFERLEEFADNGEALEVAVAGVDGARPRPGRHIWERFAEFLPFKAMDASASLGEGNTPLVDAGGRLKSFAGVNRLLLKNETQNPTWSFKDRGSLACIFMAQEMGERTTATISTGNMGHSIAAYGARSGIKALVFVPEFAPREKLMAEAITTGNPMGGDEIIAKANEHGWLAEDAAESEILEAQRVFAEAGWFVESATATVLCAVRRLRAAGRIGAGDSVALMLTGAGIKDLDALKHQPFNVIESNLDNVRSDLEQALSSGAS